jgi:hypothetical protein
MPVRKCGWIKRRAAGALVLLVLGAALTQPVLAQSRTLASLADVPAFIPAPYHPQNVTAAYSAVLYDGQPYYGGAYLGVGAHYWH